MQQVPRPNIVLNPPTYEGMRALEILRMEDLRRQEALRLGIQIVENPEIAKDNNYDSDLKQEMIDNYRRTIY